MACKIAQFTLSTAITQFATSILCNCFEKKLTKLFFLGPSEKNTCSPLEMSPLEWSYSQCPDINECLLGEHNCHVNATCINTMSTFQCKCKRGFSGKGTMCDRT